MSSSVRNSTMDFQPSMETASNKYMYVNRSVLNSIQQYSQPKVLINPNFIHVKPHFNKQFLVNQKIHVNPNLIRCNVQTEPKITQPVVNKPVVTTPTKIIRKPHVQTNNLNVIVSTRTKLVRVAKNNPQTKPVPRRSIHTTYKIIRTSPSATKKETDIKKLYYVKNRFRVDHRLPTKAVLSNRLNSLLNTKLTTKNVYIKHNSKLNKTPYVSINGILYRRNSKSLVNLNKRTQQTQTNKRTIRKKEQLLTIRGQKYKLDSNHRTLTLLSRPDSKDKPNFKSIYVGGVTFKQKEPNVFVKTNTTQKHILLSQAKQRSINTLTYKMKKSNIPCPFYHRFGKCKRKENGTCIRTHNPDQISLCAKFLQGACLDDKCLLSHKVSAEKVPTCKFYLEGRCSKDDCPYLHVKINAKADICRDFLEGFCKKAAGCDKRHQYLCPDFERDGSCAKKTCPYPHGNMVRKYKFSKNIASKLQSDKVAKGTVKNHPVCSKNIKLKHANEKVQLYGPESEKAATSRYYDESTPSATKEVLQSMKESANIDIVDLDVYQNDSEPVSPKKRPTLGKLPSFIPFVDEDKNDDFLVDVDAVF